MAGRRPPRPAGRPSPARGGSGPGTGAAPPPRGEPDGATGRLVLLGTFGRAHGIAGEVRLKSYMADPAAIASYRPLLASDGSRLTLESVREASGGQPDMLVARVDGVRDRSAAQRLNGLTLQVERERLPEPDPDEFYLVDLVGLRAEAADGWSGRIVAVPDFGGGELLEIAPTTGGPTRLLPFTRAFVPQIDVPGGVVGIAPPDGWLDDDEGATP